MLFSVCVVTEHFSIRSRFSQSNIVYERSYDVMVSDLVKFSANYLTNEPEDEVIARAVHDFLKFLKNKKTLINSRDEKIVFSEVLKKILAPLSQEIILETKYSELRNAKISVGNFCLPPCMVNQMAD